MNNSEFIFSFLKKKGCSKVFSIIGGHAMNLNAAQHKVFKKNVIYFHNEQSLSLAADSYSRIQNKPSIVSVTSGPAALNCLNGVLGAFIDNIPLIIISGQPRNSLCSTSVNDELRQYGDQEFSKITRVVKEIVKFSKKLDLNDDLEFEINNAFNLAVNGRPGPVWIDVPIDVQKEKFIKKNKVLTFNYESDKLKNPSVNKNQIEVIINKIAECKRPIIYAGSDISSQKSRNIFNKLINKLKIPVVVEWNCNDLIKEKNPLFVGKPGIRGDRKGNIITYSSDLIISIGSNLSVRQVGDVKNIFSPNSFKIMVNIDKNEIYKPNLEIDFPINSNIEVFLEKFDQSIKKKIKDFSNWANWCSKLGSKISKFDIYTDTNKLNPYNAIKKIFESLPENKIVIIGNGISVVGSYQVGKLKNNDLMFQNVGCASMGYDIPATIGACFSNSELKNKKKIICVTGDGSFQFNLQELQVIKHHQLKADIIVINNEGYSSMKQSQSNFVKNIGYHGVSKETGISFPNLEKVANTYDFKYLKIFNYKDITKMKNELEINKRKNLIIEVIVDPNQRFEPKVSSKINEFGRFELDNLYDMQPKIKKKILNDLMKLPKSLV